MWHKSRLSRYLIDLIYFAESFLAESLNNLKSRFFEIFSQVSSDYLFKVYPAALERKPTQNKLIHIIYHGHSITNKQ